MSTVMSPAGSDSAGAASGLDPDRHFTLQDALNTYALANQPNHLGNQVRDALDVIERALDQYSQVAPFIAADLQQLALSFNGGKDCTVLIHLLAAAVLLRSNRPPSPNSDREPAVPQRPSLAQLPTLLAVYVRCKSPFPQVETFVSLCTKWYHLELDAVEGGMKEALQAYLDTRKNKRVAAPGARTRRVPPRGSANGLNGDDRSVNGAVHENGNGNGNGNGNSSDTAETAAAPPSVDQIQAIMVGTRRTDPHGATLTPFVPTDPSWPSFMRVHPILDWSYKDVWDFLRCPELTLGARLGEERPVQEADSKQAGRGRTTKLEWCELYDDGYTSLGSTHNTFPNPLLRVSRSDTESDYDSQNPRAGSVSQTSHVGWRPAWELEDGNAERAGRESHLAPIAKSHALDKLDLDTDVDAEFPIGSAPNSRAASPEPANQ